MSGLRATEAAVVRSHALEALRECRLQSVKTLLTRRKIGPRYFLRTCSRTRGPRPGQAPRVGRFSLRTSPEAATRLSHQQQPAVTP